MSQPARNNDKPSLEDRHVRDYWNHNTTYHPWLQRIAAERPCQNILDVGCGDGLLLQRLTPYAGHLPAGYVTPSFHTRHHAQSPHHEHGRRRRCRGRGSGPR